METGSGLQEIAGGNMACRQSPAPPLAKPLTIAILFALWLLAVIPLAQLGYGSDYDSWRVAQAAERIWQSGHYIRSRSTGFPLFEIGVAPLVHLGGYHLSNLLAAVSGLALLAALLYQGRRGDWKDPIVTTVTVAFLPIVIVNSASTMDYMPALALLWWSYACRDRMYLPALLIGIACGFRCTSGLFLIPMAFGWWAGGRPLWKIAAAGAVAAAVAVAAFSPALLTYGLRMPQISVHLSLALQILRYGHNYLALLGLVQTVAVALIVAYVLLRKRHRRAFAASISAADAAFHLANFVLWSAAFAVMSDEPAYLLPLLPTVAFVIDRLPARSWRVACCVFLLSYHVVAVDFKGGTSGQRRFEPQPRPGYTLADAASRVWMLDVREAATAMKVDRPTLLMFGSPFVTTSNPDWVRDPKTGFSRQRNGELYLSGRILDEPLLQRLTAQGFRLVVWQDEKWEYYDSGNAALRERYVEVIPSLDAFFGRKLRGWPNI